MPFGDIVLPGGIVSAVTKTPDVLSIIKIKTYIKVSLNIQIRYVMINDDEA